MPRKIIKLSNNLKKEIKSMTKPKKRKVTGKAINYSKSKITDFFDNGIRTIFFKIFDIENYIKKKFNIKNK